MEVVLSINSQNPGFQPQNSGFHNTKPRVLFMKPWVFFTKPWVLSTKSNILLTKLWVLLQIPGFGKQFEITEQIALLYHSYKTLSFAKQSYISHRSGKILEFQCKTLGLLDFEIREQNPGFCDVTKLRVLYPSKAQGFVTSQSYIQTRYH